MRAVRGADHVEGCPAPHAQRVFDEYFSGKSNNRRLMDSRCLLIPPSCSID